MVTVRLALLFLVACSRSGSEPASGPSAETTRLEPLNGPGLMAPGLALAGDDLLLTYIAPAPAGGEAKSVTLARLRGRTWEPVGPITTSPALFANWADTPSVAAAGDGNLIAHWLQKSGADPYAYDVWLARSTDRGATWQPLGRAHDDGTATEHGFASLVPEGGGARLIWLDGRAMAGAGHAAAAPAGAMTLRTARIVGRVLVDGELIDDRVCDCCGTAAVVAGGAPLVLYRDRSPAEVRDISVVRRTGKGWTQPKPVHADDWKIDGCPVNGPAAAADGDRVAAAWFTSAGDVARVRAALSTDAGASFGPPVDIDTPHGARTPQGRVGVATDGDGGAVVSWLTGEGNRGLIRLRRVHPDGNAGPILELAETSAGRDSGFPRMVRRGTDLYIVWLQPGPTAAIHGAIVPLGAVP